MKNKKANKTSIITRRQFLKNSAAAAAGTDIMKCRLVVIAYSSYIAQGIVIAIFIALAIVAWNKRQ